MKIISYFSQELCVTHFSTSSSYSFLDNDLHLGDALGGGEYSLVSLNTRGFFSFVVFSWTLPNLQKDISVLQEVLWLWELLQLMYMQPFCLRPSHRVGTAPGHQQPLRASSCPALHELKLARACCTTAEHPRRGWGEQMSPIHLGWLRVESSDTSLKKAMAVVSSVTKNEPV